jgi:hypothetical protein
LINDKDLAERDVLNQKLETSLEKIIIVEKALIDCTKKSELTERNLLNDNRHLRVKLQALEKEGVIIQERCVKIEDIIRVYNLIYNRKKKKV